MISHTPCSHPQCAICRAAENTRQRRITIAFFTVLVGLLAVLWRVVKG